MYWEGSNFSSCDGFAPGGGHGAWNYVCSENSLTNAICSELTCLGLETIGTELTLGERVARFLPPPPKGFSMDHNTAHDSENQNTRRCVPL